MISITKLNEVFVQIDCDESDQLEIEEAMSWTVPHYVPSKTQFIWLKRRNMKMPLFNKYERTLPIGLLPDLVHFLKGGQYDFEIKSSFGAANFSEVEALEFIESLNLPEKYQVRDYQLKYFIKCVRNRRAICISPVNSGKTLLMYLIFRYFNQKTLITVPNTLLVTQIAGDFYDFGYREDIHEVTGGSEKVTDRLLTVSTWQSLQNQKKDFFEPFGAVIGDEADTNSGDKLVKIMNMMTNASVRVGLTGTMPEQMLYRKQIMGCFGQEMKYISTDELIQRGISSPTIIKMVKLNHKLSPPYSKTYEEERDYLLASKRRIEFLANLALSLKGNTFLIFFDKAQGKNIFSRIQAKNKNNIPIFYVDGDMSIKKRMEILEIVKKNKNCIVVTSFVLGRGINIPNIDNIVFAHPSKSRRRVLQSIGRGLRTDPDKPLLTVVDLFDKMVADPMVGNSTLNHALARLKIYRDEKFRIKEYEVDL